MIYFKNMAICSKCKVEITSYGSGINKYNKCSKCGEISYPTK